MSLRTALRRFATSARLSQTPAVASAAAPSAPSAPSAFSDMSQLLATPSSSFASAPATPAVVSKEAVRGYSPDAVPPSEDPSLDLFTNCLMKHGKKTEAQKMVQSVLKLLHQTTAQPPQPLLRQSILLASPSVKILSMRKSAKTILTPRALTERQRSRQGIAWILKAAEKGRKSGVSRDQRIAREVLAVLEGTSDVFKWLEDVHKSGYLNRYAESLGYGIG
ncbi:hypothetical protein I350_05278 [Cryptococcus amylolentus CBS 6273]|uniref:Small ribosomal subunit protein uS7 domain-containing protein n=1 Tax=Cryptococcus amylolentus CBS 6273 TaxID=1296118 RepID=A0A1E3JV13_9TREE|nr:hypothetical protein I350_05278 [Cryptococcus amylolentus CBS 6273]